MFFLLYGTASALTLYGAATGATSEMQPTESSLYVIDPETGAAKLIGRIGFDNVTGLAFLNDGRLVGTADGDNEFGENTSILIEINPNTGGGRLIGIIGQNDDTHDECGRVPDITYDPVTDTLYGYGDRCDMTDKFLTINTTSGEGTIIGPTGFDSGGNGLAIDLFSSILYATPSDNESLVTINPGTGVATEIPASVGNVPRRMNALAFNPDTGVLFGSLRDDDGVFGPEDLAYLTTINTSNGITNIIGQSETGLDALIFGPDPDFTRPIPTLSEWGVIAMAGILGIAGFMVIRRRKVAA